MPQITQPRVPFTYTGGALDLTQADFLSHVKAIYRVVEGQTNFVSFVPGSQYNAFNSLETGMSYIVDASSAMPNFQIPDGIQLPDTGAADGASATLTSLRALQQVPINSRFYLTDAGMQGNFQVDANDTATPDNTGLCVVNTAGQRIKRVYEGSIQVSWFGIFPYGGNSPASDQQRTLNDAAFALLLTAVPNKATIRFGQGYFRFSQNWKFTDRFINLEGSGLGTTLEFTGLNGPAIWGTRSLANKDGGYHFKGFTVLAQSKDANDGQVPSGTTVPDFGGDNNQYMGYYAGLKKNHGIQIEAPSILEEVQVFNFSGHGFRFHGNNSSEGTDSSLTKVLRCKASAGGRYGNGGCGFFLDGGDGNSLSLEGCDARDNPQAGYLDGSFLGCYFNNGCHGSENGWGHYHITNPNAAGVVASCYGEGGSPVSTISGKSQRVGGLHGNGISGGFNMEGSTCVSGISFGNLRLDSTGMTLAGQGSAGGFGLLDKSSVLSPLAHYGLRVPSSDDRTNALDLAAANVTVAVRNSVLGDRTAQNLVVAMREPIVNGLLHLTSGSWPSLTDVPYSLRPGDEIVNNDLRGTTVPRKWICQVGGLLNPPAYTEGLTATATNTDAGGIYNYALQLSGPTSLGQGTFITVSGGTLGGVAMSKTAMIGGFTPDYTAFAHTGSEFYQNSDYIAQGGVPLFLEDGSIVPGTSNLRVTQIDASNTTLRANQALPTSLAPGTTLRLRYSSDSDIGYIVFTGFLANTSRPQFVEQMPLGSNMTITLASATLYPLTRGRGTMSQRPSVSDMQQRPDHIWWEYRNETSSHLDVWNGSAWQ